MSAHQFFARAFYALYLTTTVVWGEVRCPGGTDPIRYHSLQNSEIGISVRINGSGPYEFVLDTGSQMTLVEPSLAKELRLETAGHAGVLSAVRHAVVDMVRLDRVETGPYSVEQSLAAVQSLEQIQGANPGVRGMLGENFLARFDLLIDHAHRIVCFDRNGQMRQELRGDRISLVMDTDPAADLRVPQPLLIPVELGDRARPGKTMRHVNLLIDSGANVPQLFVNTLETAPWKQRQNALQGRVTGNAAQFFALMPGQDIHIGKHVVSNVVFATPLNAPGNVDSKGEDGLLPTSLFRRVLISYADRYVILDPR